MQHMWQARVSIHHCCKSKTTQLAWNRKGSGMPRSVTWPGRRRPPVDASDAAGSAALTVQVERELKQAGTQRLNQLMPCRGVGAGRPCDC